jgi:molybdenum-dependent DNA-binding transcriptional regulator ModE
MPKNAGVQRMREELPQAVAAMKDAELELAQKAPAKALPPARKALQHLQRAEAAFHDAQIAMSRAGGGGGAADAQDLANLFRLEMDKLRNKYESVKRGNWQQGDQQLDEALEKLKELARRQQQELERLERRAEFDPKAPSDGGSQRALAEELEEMVRRLERLSRENMTPELRNLTRQAQAAAQAMRRASGRGADGVADARAALDRLQNIERQTGNQPQQRLQRGIDNAARRAERLAREHEDIGADVEALSEDQSARRAGASKLQSRKLRMAEEVQGLESELRELVRGARKDQASAEAARALRDAADAIARDNLANKIELSAAAIDHPGEETSRRMEAEIGASLTRIGDDIGEAARAVDQSGERERAQKLAQMRELVQGLESLERRMLNRTGRGRTGTVRGGWGNADGQVRFDGDLNPADIADFRREFAERRGLLEQLVEVMNADEHGARDISRLLGEMRDIEQGEDFNDPQRALLRQRQLIAQLKELELRLKSDASEGEQRTLLLSGNDDVPPGYRPQVEEYFRELSRADTARRRAD